MSFRIFAVAGLAVVAVSAAGCADNQSLLGSNSSNLTTSAVTPVAAKVDPACSGLASQIDGLRREGFADKVDKATQKKAKVTLTAAETAKVDQLNKANFEFQTKCSNFKPAASAAVAPATAPAVTTASATAAAKSVANTASQAKAAATTAKVASTPAGAVAKAAAASP